LRYNYFSVVDSRLLSVEQAVQVTADRMPML